MEPLTITIIGITILFLVALALKSVARTDRPWCSLCLAVSATWIALLALTYAGLFTDRTLIALLMGQSVVGVFYVLEANVPKRWTLFRLPALLTLTIIAYSAVTASMTGASVLLLLALWFVFGIVYALRDRGARAWFNKIIDCCRRW